MTQKNPKARIKSREQVQKALDLRKSGATYGQIGSLLSISKTRAYQLVTEGMSILNIELKESAAQLLEIELARLDGLVAAHWPLKDRPRSAEVLLKVCDRRARLLGLYAPVRIVEEKDEEEPKPIFDFSVLTDEELATARRILEKGLITENLPANGRRLELLSRDKGQNAGIPRKYGDATGTKQCAE